MVPEILRMDAHAQLNEGGESHEGENRGEGMIPKILCMDAHAQLNEGGESHEGKDGVGIKRTKDDTSTWMHKCTCPTE
jgi:hypothetical protein